VLAATSGAVNIRLQAVDGQREQFTGQVPELAHLAVVVGLVWRTVVLWMLLLALLTLARLLG
jgi:adenosylcobinamide-phosphate synthase